MCHENIGDEYREGNDPYGVRGLCCLENDIANDHGEINLWPIGDVVDEVGYLDGEVVVVSHRDEVVGEHSPKKFHNGLAILVRELGALTNVLCA